MKMVKLAGLLLIGWAALGAGGCAVFESEITYNPYARNNGETPVLRAAEDVLNAPEEALNEFDRRFENIVY
jgi:hypothetical protein